MKLNYEGITIEVEGVEEAVALIGELAKLQRIGVTDAARELQRQINAEHGRLGGLATAKKRRQEKFIQPFEA
jgi:hypothetical protein